MNRLYYWNGETPNLNNISIALIPETRGLSAEEIGILYRIAWFIGSRSVKSFYADVLSPEMPSDPETISRIVGCSAKEWERAKPQLLPFLTALKDGQFTLKDLEQIRISTGSSSRPGLPMSTKKLAAARDGHRCVYCGDVDGPFHFDHLFPRSRGGSDQPDNIVVACAPCNLSKGDKTLLEWMSVR